MEAKTSDQAKVIGDLAEAPIALSVGEENSEIVPVKTVMALGRLDLKNYVTHFIQVDPARSY